MPRLPDRTRVLVSVLVCQMGLGLGAYVFATFLKPIVVEMGWSRAAFSISSLPLLLAMSAASPVIGTLTDRLGARVVFSGAITAVSVTLFLFSQMRGLADFYVLGFVLGAAVTGLGDIPAGAVVSRWFRENRGLALGVVYVGSNIGGAIVPLVATSVTDFTGWRTALQILAVGSWLWVFPFAFFGVRGGDEGGGPAREEDGDDDAGSLTLAQALRTANFWILAAGVFLFYVYYLGVNNHLVAYLSDVGFSDAAAARRFSAAVAVGIIGKIGMGLLADRIPKLRALVVLFLALTVASVLLLGVERLPGLLVPFLILHGLTVAAENVVLPLAIAECFGAKHMAAIYGAIMLALLPGGVIGPTLSGWVFDELGSYRLAFTLFAVTNVATVIALSRLRPLR
ncbi:MAG: MFS transporter [Candidatus Binatia bacterium]